MSAKSYYVGKVLLTSASRYSTNAMFLQDALIKESIGSIADLT